MGGFLNGKFFQKLLKLIDIAYHWHPGKLARDTAKMTLGMGLRSFIQVGVFIIVTRVLGVADYGAYNAVLALASALGGFCGFGTQALIVRDVSRNPSHFSIAWGLALTAITISVPILFSIYIVLAYLVLPDSVSFYVIVLLGIAELFFAPISVAAITAYQGHERIGRSARLVLVPVVPRLVGALLLFPITQALSAELRLTVWAILYAIAALLASLYGCWLVRKDLGPAVLPSSSALWRGLREGLPFAFGGVALRLYADIDKTMLAYFTTLTTVGAYSAGYRLADMASLPVIALLIAALPRFFRAGQGELRHVLANGYRILPVPFAYAAIAGVGLYLGAEFLPYILGNHYAITISTLRWLAWLPVISLPRMFLQDLLIGGNRQQGVVVILSVGALLNIGLNSVVIPLWGWRGAVASTYSTEVIMALMMFLMAWIATRSSSHVGKPEITDNE